MNHMQHRAVMFITFILSMRFTSDKLLLFFQYMRNIQAVYDVILLFLIKNFKRCNFFSHARLSQHIDYHKLFFLFFSKFEQFSCFRSCLKRLSLFGVECALTYT